MITAFGKTYQTVADAQARWTEIEKVNAQWGRSDDRVTEQNALRAAIAEVEDVWEPGRPCRTCGGPTLAARPDHPEEQGDYCEACGKALDVWTVEKNEYSVPCEHPLCEQLHQRFMTTHTFRGLVSAGGVYVEREITQRFHDRNVAEWVVLLNGKREGAAGNFDAYDTKREALDALRRAGLLPTPTTPHKNGA